MYGIILRQFTNPWYTNDMADDDYLKVLENYYEVQPVEVDGNVHQRGADPPENCHLTVKKLPKT